MVVEKRLGSVDIEGGRVGTWMRSSIAGLAFGLAAGCSLNSDTGVGGESESGSETGSGGSTGESTPSTSAAASSASSQTGASMTGSGGADDDGLDATTASDTTVGGSVDAGGDAGTGQGSCGDAGSECDVGFVCIDGACVPDRRCEQADGEPNDDESSAVDVGELECGADPLEIEGGLDGADLDWFTTVPVDGGLCIGGSPSATVSVEGEAEVTVCMYAQCTAGGTSVGCGFGGGAGMPDTSPDGAEGCCKSGAVSLESVSCQSLDQSHVAWVRVSAAQAECLPYTLTLEY